MTTGFYVTLKDGPRTAWLLGPFATHDEALARVDEAWNRACDVDPRCHFAFRGTASITRDAALDTFPQGRLNSLMGA